MRLNSPLRYENRAIDSFSAIQQKTKKYYMYLDFMHEADLVRGVCGAHRAGYETAEVRDVRELMGSADCVEDQEKEKWMGCFLDDLKTFDISTLTIGRHWTTAAAQDDGE